MPLTNSKRFHPEILTLKQKELLPLIKHFSKDFYLVGGTAIALYLGHRYTVDFDLFTPERIKPKSIRHHIENKLGINITTTIHEDFEQMHIVVNEVKVTFFSYKFPIETPINFNSIIKLPTLLDLAGMKAFALGGRGKWKDYVDLYFLLKNHFTVKEISERTTLLFGEGNFNPRLFRQQLAFYKDINYSEPVEYIGNPVTENEIKKFLTEVSLTKF